MVKKMFFILIVMIIMAGSSIPSFGQETAADPNAWLSGKWETKSGDTSYNLTVTGQSIEGDGTIRTREGNKLRGNIRNGMVEGETVKFEGVFQTRGQKGPPTVVSKYEFKRDGENLKGNVIRADGTTQAMTLIKK